MSGIGNFVMFTPVISELKKRFPDADITLLLPENGCADVIEGHPYVKKILSFDLFQYKWRREFFTLLRKIRRMGFDTVIVSPMKFPGAFIAFSSRAKNRIGHYYQLGSVRKSPFLYNYPVEIDDFREHEVRQNLNLLRPFNVSGEIHPRMIVNARNDYADLTPGLGEDKKTIGIHPGCGSDQTERRWPKEHFIELANRLNEGFDMNLVFFAGPDERELVSEIVGSINKKPILVIDKPLKYVISVISKCNYFITTDSGLGHIANGLGVPTLAMFGPANPNRTGPYGNGNLVVKKGLPCAPCYLARGQRIECSDIRCLKDLSADEVLDGFKRLIEINEDRF
jgi:lipopolysaccharide heptosyltransferase II